MSTTIAKYGLAGYVVHLDTPSVFRSIYASELTTSSDMYSRDQCQSSDYYYQALRFDVEMSGIYRFQRESKIYMYGYLYRDTFDPTKPDQNLLSENGRICLAGILWLNASLCSNATYILVPTTDVPARTGVFKIHAFGAANITFSLVRE